MKVRLNLATKALATHRRFLAGAGLTAFFAGLAFLGLGWHVYSARKAQAELRLRTEKTRREMATLIWNASCPAACASSASRQLRWAAMSS